MQALQDGETTGGKGVGPRRPLAPDLSLRVPVVEAALGEVGTVELAAAISRAGALGTLTLYAPTLVQTRCRVARLRALTRRPALIAFTGEWEREENLTICRDAGLRHFQVFWWNGPRLCQRIQRAGGVVFWQVGTVGQIDEALQNGADVLVAQGTEAGGPVRTPIPLLELIDLIRAMAGETIPVVAGGGLADSSDVARVLARGADAAMLGTRFLLADEARVPDRQKARLLRSSSEDLYLDTSLRGLWPCSPRRILKNVADDDSPMQYAGLGLGRIHSIRPAAEIVRELAPKHGDPRMFPLTEC